MKNKVPSSPWVVREETVKEGKKWMIGNKKADMEIYAYNDRFKDGIHIKGFYIQDENSASKYLSRSEFRELIEKVLACMAQTERQKVHAQPDSDQMVKVFESLGAAVEVPQPDDTTPKWYVMDRSNLEAVYQRLGGQAV